jgi:hypothetical protein
MFKKVSLAGFDQPMPMLPSGDDATRPSGNGCIFYINLDINGVNVTISILDDFD